MFPWQIQVSGVFQSIPPDSILATYPVSNAEASASLGRPATFPSVNVALIEPATEFLERVNQLDLRVSKSAVAAVAPRLLQRHRGHPRHR